MKPAVHRTFFWLYWFLMFALWVTHAVMVLRLGSSSAEQGSTDTFQRLFSDEPLLQGQHALHQHLGSLGFWPSYMLFHDKPVTDLSYQAGYLKSPWFDASSRPAEVFRLLDGWIPSAASYKLGMCITWFLVPFAICLATKGLGLQRPVVCLANLLSVLWCWSGFGQQVLEQGDLDVIWGSCCLVIAMSWLGRSLITASLSLFFCWLFPMIAALFFWPFLGPTILFILLTSLALAIGRRTYGAFPEIVGGGILVFALNSPWLISGWKLWWYLAEPTLVISSSSMQSLFPWNVGLVSSSLGILFTLGAISCLLIMKLYGLFRTQAWPLAAACGCGLLGAWIVPAWINAPLSLPYRWWIAVLLWGILPASALLVLFVRWLAILARSRFIAIGLVIVCCIFAAWSISDRQWNKCKAELMVKPMSIGKPPLMDQMLEKLAKYTTPSARVLLEESSTIASWSPLLSRYSGMSFIGGLGLAQAVPIEPLSLRLIQGQLVQRALTEWTDNELEVWCTRYNIGWIIAYKDVTKSRLKAWPLADEPVSIGENWSLFGLKRTTRWTLVGSAKLESMDHHSMTLTDLQPEDGNLILSFHYWPGMQTSNLAARLSPLAVKEDNQPLIKLELSSPLPRLRIEW